MKNLVKAIGGLIFSNFHDKKCWLGCRLLTNKNSSRDKTIIHYRFQDTLFIITFGIPAGHYLFSNFFFDCSHEIELNSETKLLAQQNDFEVRAFSFHADIEEFRQPRIIRVIYFFV